MSLEEKLTFFDASKEKSFESFLITPKIKQLHQDLLQEGFRPLGILGERNNKEVLYNLIYCADGSLPNWISAILMPIQTQGKIFQESVYLTSDFQNKGTVITVSGTENWFETPQYFHCGLLDLPISKLRKIHEKMSLIYAKRFETQPEPINCIEQVVFYNQQYFELGLDQILEKEHQQYLRKNRNYFNVRFTLGSIILMLIVIALGFSLKGAGHNYWVPLFLLWIALYVLAKKSSPYWKRYFLKKWSRQRYESLRV
ncbi:MAG: hypothetical protein AABZ60_10035 [Planctomycetota bacterium]